MLVLLIARYVSNLLKEHYYYKNGKIRGKFFKRIAQKKRVRGGSLDGRSEITDGRICETGRF